MTSGQKAVSRGEAVEAVNKQTDRRSPPSVVPDRDDDDDDGDGEDDGDGGGDNDADDDD